MSVELAIKICCIASRGEAQTALRHGAAAIGLVAAMPSGPGPIPEQRIAEIAASLPATVDSFLLTSHRDLDAIVDQQARCGVTTVQLCDRLATGSYADLRAAMPGVAIVQVIHVTGRDAISAACALASQVDALLLDSGNPAAPIKELGGTGRTHDWEISREICRAVSVPVFLAGGLHAGNVARAISRVRPYGVDVCSGVRSAGVLDEEKLGDFIAAVRSES
jgi:phosphoribosylanthranilate isomerase